MPTYIDRLTKERLNEEAIQELVWMPLPADSWYPDDVCPDDHPARLCPPLGSNFALIADRWVPVWVHYRELTCTICKGGRDEK